MESVFLAGFKPVSPSDFYISILTWTVRPTPATIYLLFLGCFHESAISWYWKFAGLVIHNGGKHCLPLFPALPPHLFDLFSVLLQQPNLPWMQSSERKRLSNLKRKVCILSLLYTYIRFNSFWFFIWSSNYAELLANRFSFRTRQSKFVVILYIIRIWQVLQQTYSMESCGYMLLLPPVSTEKANVSQTSPSWSCGSCQCQTM